MPHQVVTTAVGLPTDTNLEGAASTPSPAPSEPGGLPAAKQVWLARAGVAGTAGAGEPRGQVPRVFSRGDRGSLTGPPSPAPATRYVISSLELLVAEDYMIVYLNGATPRRRMPGIGWLKKCYQMIDRR